MNWLGLVFAAIGGFTIGGAAMDWDWFMENRKARVFVSLFGRTGARIFYAILGLFILGIGIAGLCGFIELAKSR